MLRLIINIIFTYLTLSPVLFAQFTFTAVGDIMLNRGVGNRIKMHGVEYPFLPTAEILKDSDLTFANLECQVSTLGKPMPGKEYHFRANPQVIKGLVYAGIDIVSLSNNHSMDYGKEALSDTINILRKNCIIPVGAGINKTQAYQSADFIINNINISILAYSWNFYLTIKAEKDNAGIAIIEKEQIASAIKNVKRWADIVIISFHWGWEYSDEPTNKDREIAHFVIDHGANLVIGHHPHVIQGIELYKNALICYSLGNFIFDQHDPDTQKGVILRSSFDVDGLLSAEFIPICIDAKEYRPKIVNFEFAEDVFRRVYTLSKENGIYLTPDKDIKLYSKK